MNLEFSRRLALLGIVPPIADTIRRWHQLGDLKIWPFWLDDFLLRCFQLFGNVHFIRARSLIGSLWGNSRESRRH
jgi:hypothetical protein